MNQFDYIYLERRLEEELQMAEASSDPITASAHRRMATHYAEKLAELRPPPPVEVSPPAAI